MNGDAAIVWTIRVAIGLYALSALCRARPRVARTLFTTAWLTYFLHVAAVFHFAHHWSHDAAFQYTQTRTAEITGIAFGGGLWVNYAFTLLWTLEVLWWWLDSNGYQRRPRWLNALIDGTFLFIIFNATVVFGVGAVRWYGIVVSGLMLSHLLFGRERLFMSRNRSKRIDAVLE